MLDLRDIGKSFDSQHVDTPALADVTLNVQRGEFFILLGPSGCGKTTTLRSIAGLETPDRGRIQIDGTTVFSGDDRIFVRPEYRDIGMVFQSYAVWPHMSVYDNIAFPLRAGVRRVAAAEARRRVTEMLALMGLSALAQRPASTLSGGQQQRVAIARGLALRPKILLMDEPLSNLDLSLQKVLRMELKKVTRDFEVTTVYVTHNQAEAMEMGDRLAVMEGGRVRQCGSPEEIYNRPQDEFIARFIGEISLLPAECLGQRDDGLVEVQTPVGRVTGRAAPALEIHRGAPCFFGVRPENLQVVRQADRPIAGFNVMTGVIALSRYAGDSWIHSVVSGDVKVQLRTPGSIRLAAGERVQLQANPLDCIVLSRREMADRSAAIQQGTP